MIHNPHQPFERGLMVVLWNATQIGCFGLHKMSLNGNRTAEYPGRWTGAGGKRRDEESTIED